MYKNARLLLGILFLFILITNCQKTTPSALRIVNINDGDPVSKDILDFWVSGSGEDIEEHETYLNLAIPVEVAYTEQGSGLPTPTPYTAHVTNYRVSFTDVSNAEPLTFDGIQGGCDFLIESDPEGKNTVTQSLLVIPTVWTVNNYDNLADGITLSVKITLTGVDIVSNQSISCEGTFTAELADFDDDPLKQGS